MLPRLFITGFASVLILFCALPSLAATRYISDQLVVSLREQPRADAKVVTYLRSAMAVELLEETGDYAQVKTATGQTGYVKKNYLVSATPKATIIKRLEKDLVKKDARIKDLEEQYTQVASQGDETQKQVITDLRKSRELATGLEKDLKQARQELDKARNDYQTLKKNAKEVVQITEERDRLKVDNNELAVQAAALEEERDALLQKETTRWFLSGAFVLFAGWLLGKISRQRRRQSSLMPYD